MGGIGIGLIAPGPVQAIAAAELASINLVVAVLIRAMVYPMMVGVDFGAVAGVARQPRGPVLTLAVNWLVKPFTTALLALLFFGHAWASLITPEDAQPFTAGLILPGVTEIVVPWETLALATVLYVVLSLVALPHRPRQARVPMGYAVDWHRRPPRVAAQRGSALEDSGIEHRPVPDRGSARGSRSVPLQDGR